MRADLDDPQLRPFLPLLYVAWADGDLSSDELSSLGQRVTGQPWLSPPARDALRSWLDPLSPPEPRELYALLERIQKVASNLDEGDRGTLADLGLTMAKVGDCKVPPEARLALQDIERTLGVAGRELVRGLSEGGRPAPDAGVPQPSVPVDALSRYLDGEQADTRARVREFLSDAEHRAAFDTPRESYRVRVLGWLKELADRGIGGLAYPTISTKKDTLEPFMVAFETLALGDMSLLVKFGVQFGLFGGSIYFLGTDEQRQRYLPDVASLALPGCFAMSELGHGSNVVELETVARYDAETDSIVVHTPKESARKEWIGNAARHGRLATVFAQLEVGGESHGVHAILVPIRDEHGDVAPNVRIGDCGPKMGLEGVDNGRLWFDGVRVPRDHLLGRFAAIDDDGRYTSPIPGASKRFFTMLGTLVAGRVSVASGAVSAMKVALAIAIRYGDARRQFGPEGKPELRLLDYPSHQLRLLPRLAEAYALHFAIDDVRRRYASASEEDMREIEGFAAGIKAYGTDRACRSIAACREACGGQGYLTVNRLPGLVCDTEVFKTFEGDNTVLLQLVAKGLLSGYTKQFQEARFVALLKDVARIAASTVVDKNPFTSRWRSAEHLLDVDYHRQLLEAREQDLLRSAALRIKRRLDDGHDVHVAFLDVQDHLLAMSQAHVERWVHGCFVDAVERAPEELRPALARLRDLWTLGVLSDDADWFLENGFFEKGKIRSLRKLRRALCAEVREDATGLVDAFGIPDACLAAPIAFGDPGRPMSV